MTRKTKLSYDECKAELQLFTIAAYRQYQTDSYATGYFESMLASALAELPKAAQARLIEQVRTSSVLQAK